MKILIFLTTIMSTSTSAYSGLLLSTSLSWSVFSIRPLQEEDDSPNYYGIGPGLIMGYSIRQTLDLGGFIDYTPGVEGSVYPGKEEASIVRYGGILALRLREKIYFGLKGGTGVYHLMSKKFIPNELPGIWQGPVGALILGAIYKADKQNFWQLSFEIIHMVIDRIQLEKGEVRTGKRRIDEFKLTFTYSFNGFFNHLVRNSLFRSVF